MIGQLTLNSDLVESVRKVAIEQGQSIETVLNDLMREYLQQARKHKIDREQGFFERVHTDLKKNYLGQHVAIHQEQLIDHDSNLDSLVKRVQDKFGRMPILFALVGNEPVPTFNIRRPQLLGTE